MKMINNDNKTKTDDTDNNRLTGNVELLGLLP